MPIRKLSQLMINQIAAGEVIERPASVVKELVENALDAGATRIEIQIEDGGRELIRVADNGSGIPPEELPLTIQPHATSKVQSPEQLEAIATLGFRGEALASMASIARFRITSRTTNADAGAVLEAAGEQVDGPKPVGCAVGTVVEVRNLFFNTPARRKFMRGTATEWGHIADTVNRLAMAHNDAGIKLIHNSRTNLDLPADQTPAQRCNDLLGGDLTQGMLEFEDRQRSVSLWGMAGTPAMAKASRKHQYIFCNGRAIRDTRIYHAIKEAYRGLIDPSRHPPMVLFIAVDPAMVDVNVHPTKSEVRFADANLIHGLTLATIRQRLLSADLTPQAHLQKPTDRQRSSEHLPADPLNDPNGDQRLPTPTAPSSASGHFPHATASLTANADSGQGHRRSTSPATSMTDFVNHYKQQAPPPQIDYTQTRNAMASMPSPASTAPTSAPSQPVLQVHNSYLVTQDEQGLLIIDQHALHERVVFQTLIQRIRSHGSLESQRMLTPATLQVTDSQMALLADLAPLLEQLGIQADQAGPKTIAVHAFPTLLFDRNVAPEQFMADLLDTAEQDDLAPDDEASLHTIIDMMSCKAAVKAGDRLKPEEMAELIQRRDEVQRASSCPHGRPTAIRMTLSELEKQFKRT